MRLLPSDIRAFPMPAGLFDPSGSLLDHSPEWAGAGPGSKTYRMADLCLVVSDGGAAADVAALSRRLLSTVRKVAADMSGDARRRIEMLAAGLGVVGGDPRLRPGSIAETVENLHAAVATFSPVPVDVKAGVSGNVPDPALVAHALKQIVVNAKKHDNATVVQLRVEPGPQFVVEWKGAPIPGGLATSRHPAYRDRWGLGFVRLAADALGAVYLAPFRVAPGRLRAVLSIEPATQIALPLAAVDADDRIERASEGWTDETHSSVGDPVDGLIKEIVSQARAGAGDVVAVGPLRARSVPRRTWLAIPPQGPLDRARDIIRGLAHEQDLWEAPEPERTIVQALGEAIAFLLGDPFPVSEPAYFDATYPAACSLLGIHDLGRPYPGAIAPEPVLTAYLVAELGGRLEASPLGCTVRVPAAQRRHPLAERVADDQGVLHLVTSG